MIGRLRRLVGRLWERLRSRPDTEHEQALVRLSVGVILFFYLLPKAATQPGEAARLAEQMFAVMVAYLGCAIAILIAVARSRDVSVARRLVSIVLDVGAASYFLAVLDARGLPLLVIYIWVTVANGFRFGPRYLLFALAASLAGFSMAVYVNPYWRDAAWTALAIACLAAAFCIYVLTLVRRMFAALAKAEAANQAKRRFVSVVSHEMRTPLNAIIGMTDMLGESSLIDEQVDMVGTISTASKTLLRLVEDVLDFSKIEAGRLVVERTDFDLHALVNATLRIIRPQAEAKGLALTVTIMPEVPHALRGDPHHLRQVLINLVSNAVKFTAQGSVVVHLSLLAESEDGARVKFSVRDTGIGIPPEVQGRIFESFVQADQSTTRKYGGTGLGTAIAKQLVELMGGRIGLESAVGLGSTFWFELEFPKQADAPSSAPAEGMLSGERVLCVGFRGEEGAALLESLRGWGAGVVAAGSTEAAAQRLAVAGEESRPFHSLLLHADSVLAARQAIAVWRRADGQMPPVVLCLAAAERPVAVAGELEEGFAAVLHMPVQSRLLYNALHALSALEDRAAAAGVVRLADYLRKREREPGLRILVADDSAVNRDVIGKILERGGHSVALVEDGEEALDRAETGDFDLVILDRNMRGMDGVATAKALRALGLGQPRLPVMIVSADVTQEARKESLEAGADAFLGKPLQAVHLLEQVSELCRAAPRRRAPEADAAKPAPRAAAVVAAINTETLRQLESLGSQSGFVERLVASFVADQTELVEQMERAARAGDFAEFRRLLHAMKGSAASLGVERLAHACQEYHRLPDDELRRRANLVESIRQEFERARKALDQYLEERRRTAG